MEKAWAMRGLCRFINIARLPQAKECFRAVGRRFQTKARPSFVSILARWRGSDLSSRSRGG
jgi:hypothetical protein